MATTATNISTVSNKDKKVKAGVGAIPRGSFTCEARCFCPIGDSVWVGERSGLITIRCARTGDVLTTVEPSSTNYLFACSMLAVNDEVWVGSTDGRLVVFDAQTQKIIVELLNPETERNGEIHSISVEGNSLFTANANCRVAEWDIAHKLFVKSFVHDHSVNGVATTPYTLFSCDDSGVIIAWDLRSGERRDSTKDSIHAGLTMLIEENTQTLWCGRKDGSVDVYALEPNMTRIASLKDAKARIHTLMQVGGKVWGAGLDRNVYVWHATTRTLLGSIKDHSAFLFSIKKLYTMETARVWTLSNDKTVHVYDAEGFFAPVSNWSAVHDEVASAQTMTSNLRKENALLEKKLAIAEEKVTLRDAEMERLKAETSQQTLKIHSLEHVVDTKEETLQLNNNSSHKMMEEMEKLTARVGELTLKVNNAEQEKAVLRGDIARTQEELSRSRAQVQAKVAEATMSSTENVALASDKTRLQKNVEEKEKQTVELGFLVKSLRDENANKKLELAKVTAEMDLMKTRMAEMERERENQEQSYKSVQEEKRRLEDTVILRENEGKELMNQLASLNNAQNQSTTALSDLEYKAQIQIAEAKRLEDSYALRTHEHDLLEQEKKKLIESLQHEKAQVHDARTTENKLRLQNDELRRQLETEKNNVKMLEDQYTIFQFVINSRGELVNSIWDLHARLENAQKSVKSFDVSLKHVDPTKDKVTFKREWKTTIVEKSANNQQQIQDVCAKADYIVANFFSEYEKMHLGVSASKFPPDVQRPAIVGDQLLTKLRDVTLQKQYSQNRPALASTSASQLNASNTILPPPHDAMAMGPHHTAPLGQSSFHHTF